MLVFLRVYVDCLLIMLMVLWVETVWRLATAAPTAGPPPNFLKRVSLLLLGASLDVVTVWSVVAHANTCRHRCVP